MAVPGRKQPLARPRGRLAMPRNATRTGGRARNTRNSAQWAPERSRRLTPHWTVPQDDRTLFYKAREGIRPQAQLNECLPLASSKEICCAYTFVSAVLRASDSIHRTFSKASSVSAVQANDLPSVLQEEHAAHCLWPLQHAPAEEDLALAAAQRPLHYASSDRTSSRALKMTPRKLLYH